MNQRYDVCEGLAQIGKAGIGADTLAVPEPSAVKVAWAVLWLRFTHKWTQHFGSGARGACKQRQTMLTSRNFIACDV